MRLHRIAGRDGPGIPGVNDFPRVILHLVRGKEEPVEARRGNFQRIGPVDDLFRVQRQGELPRDAFALIHGGRNVLRNVPVLCLCGGFFFRPSGRVHVQADEHAAGFDDFEAPYLQILGPDGGPGQL